MPIVNRVADLHREITAWRRDLHAHPELLFDVQRTAGDIEPLPHWAGQGVGLVTREAPAADIVRSLVAVLTPSGGRRCPDSRCAPSA